MQAWHYFRLAQFFLSEHPVMILVDDVDHAGAHLAPNAVVGALHRCPAHIEFQSHGGLHDAHDFGAVFVKEVLDVGSFEHVHVAEVAAEGRVALLLVGAKFAFCGATTTSWRSRRSPSP